jgi:hypothetical protein
MNHQDITGLFIGLLSGLDPSLSGFAFIFFWTSLQGQDLFPSVLVIFECVSSQ